jgi:hypothetical protein
MASPEAAAVEDGDEFEDRFRCRWLSTESMPSPLCDEVAAKAALEQAFLSQPFLMTSR